MTCPPVLVIVRTRDPHRQAEALRAALGLTLRGARVEVAIEGAIEGPIEGPIEGDAPGDAGDVDQALATPLARRAAATLRSFGYPVGIAAGEALAAALARAGRVEVWT
jgi:hypothetical protein